MNRKLLTLIVASVLLLVITLFVADGWIYGLTFLLAIAIIKIIRYFNSGSLKLTRWAKENPGKTQVLITVIQILILFLGLLVGYDLKELGYQLSDTPILVFAIILTSGFLVTSFLPKRNPIVIPATVNKNRIAFTSIALSAFVVMVITGNGIEDKFPDSFVAHSLSSVDRAIFSEAVLPDDEMYSIQEAGTDQPSPLLINENSSMVAFASLSIPEEKSVSPTIDPGKEAPGKLKAEKKLEKKTKKMMKRIEKLRKAFAAGATVGTVLLIILLVITTCAGVCLILAGGSAGAVALGVVVLGLSIWAFIKTIQKNKRTNTG